MPYTHHKHTHVHKPIAHIESVAYMYAIVYAFYQLLLTREGPALVSFPHGVFDSYNVLRDILPY